MRHFEKTLDSALVYDGKIIKVLRDEALLENGAAAVREVVRHRGAVAVLASYSNRLCVLVLNEDFIASGPSCH